MTGKTATAGVQIENHREDFASIIGQVMHEHREACVAEGNPCAWDDAIDAILDAHAIALCDILERYHTRLKKAA